MSVKIFHQHEIFLDSTLNKAISGIYAASEDGLPQFRDGSYRYPENLGLLPHLQTTEEVWISILVLWIRDSKETTRPSILSHNFRRLRQVKTIQQKYIFKIAPNGIYIFSDIRLRSTACPQLFSLIIKSLAKLWRKLECIGTIRSTPDWIHLLFKKSVYTNMFLYYEILSCYKQLFVFYIK